MDPQYWKQMTEWYFVHSWHGRADEWGGKAGEDGEGKEGTAVGAKREALFDDMLFFVRHEVGGSSGSLATRNAKHYGHTDLPRPSPSCAPLRCSPSRVCGHCSSPPSDNPLLCHCCSRSFMCLKKVAALLILAAW